MHRRPKTLQRIVYDSPGVQLSDRKLELLQDLPIMD